LQQQQQHTIALLQRLQRDVIRCVYADRSYSPYCDMAKSLAGVRRVNDESAHVALSTCHTAVLM
jgi:hypothetical protein